jgi:hypothetical protein
VSDVRITSGESDSDFLTFAAAAAGGSREYFLAMTMRQDNATTSLWSKAWSETGQTAPYEVWPNGRPGGGTPTATQPRFVGSVVIKEPDGDFVGGEADNSTSAVFTTEVEWQTTARPGLQIA